MTESRGYCLVGIEIIKIHLVLFYWNLYHNPTFFGAYKSMFMDFRMFKMRIKCLNCKGKRNIQRNKTDRHLYCDFK